MAKSPERRFPPPWSIEQQPACIVVRDHNGQVGDVPELPYGALVHRLKV
jgi:hypothetical protein